MKTHLQFHLVAVLSLLLPTLTSQAVKTAPATSAASTGLLQFISRGHVLGFTADGMVAATGSHALHVGFVGANNTQPQADASAHDKNQAAPLGRVAYADLWDGVSLTYTASPGSIYRTNYTLAPGANAKKIRLRYNTPLTLNKDGTLHITFKNGAMTESAPIAWQEIHGKRVDVAVAFRLRGQEVSFALGKYDPRHALVIDPSLIWNTFLGGSGFDTGRAIATDWSGNFYITGSSTVTWGDDPVRGFTSSSRDAFVAKVDSTGALVWNTFLGGSVQDLGLAIAVDYAGVYVGGTTGESASGGSGAWGCSLPCTTVRAFSGNGDAFVAKLNRDSGVMQWNTFLGGTGVDYGYGIAMDGTSHSYVVGESGMTWGCSLPCTTARSFTGSGDAFAAKLGSDGAMIWNTFLGGSENDSALAVAVDDTHLYVAGKSSQAWSCPVNCTARGFTNSISDAFAAILNTSDGALTRNTFLGGSGADYASGIAVDANSVYVVGYSTADWGDPQRDYSSGTDAFAAKISLSDGTMTWNTFLGLDGTDFGFGIAVDEDGNAYVVGTSDATWGNPMRPHSLYKNAFVARLAPSGALTWNTFLGGGGDDGFGIITDWSGAWFMVSGTSIHSWSCTPTACTQRAYTSSDDAFVAKVDLMYRIFLPLVQR